MPYFCASAAALPGVGEATATTSASCAPIWKAAAWMSASNCDPIIPTLTFPFFVIASPLSLLTLSSATNHTLLRPHKNSYGRYHNPHLRAVTDVPRSVARE